MSDNDDDPVSGAAIRDAAIRDATIRDAASRDAASRDAGSPQAAAFLSANPAAAVVAPDAATIEEFRRTGAEDFRIRAERALKQRKVTVRDITIANVPCLEVLPLQAHPAGTVLYCYGGGFICGSAFEDLIISAPLAELANVRIVAPKYRLAPEHPWPAAIDDGFAVYRHLELENKSDGFAIAGESAGGNMALALMFRAAQAGLSLPEAAALLSPWCDLQHKVDGLPANADGLITNAGSLVTNDGRDPTLSLAWVEAAAAMYAGTHDRSHPDVSPINGTFTADYPPVLITTGTRDLLMSQSRQLAGILEGVAIPTELKVWEGLWHVFEFYDELPEADASLREIAHFLRHHLEVPVATP